MAKQTCRVMGIGLDARTVDVIAPLIEECRLPNFGGLVREGVPGPLESIFPPGTPPEWVSFMTGMNRGKDGVL